MGMITMGLDDKQSHSIFKEEKKVKVQYKVPPLTEDKARKLVTALRKVIADALKEKELDPLSDNELFDRCAETLTRSYDRIVRAPLLEELNDL